MKRNHFVLGSMLLEVFSLGCGDGGTGITPSPASWKKHAGNPVLVPGPAGSWDALGVASPFVTRLASGSYALWYAGWDSAATRIGLANSSDGVIWTKHAGNPVFGPGAAGTWDARAVRDPCVLWDGAGYRMYYAGRGAGSSGIGLATSSDGIHWSRFQADPVLVPNPPGTPWDDEEVYTPWVLAEGSVYKMWYGGNGAEYRAVGYATSADGVSWAKVPAPVLNPQALEALTFAPCVLRAGARYRMWYTALHETPGGGIFPGVIDYAQSSDGLDWTPAGLALSYGPAAAWDGGRLRSACVLEAGGSTRMWYAAESASGQGSIGLASFQ